MTHTEKIRKMLKKRGYPRWAPDIKTITVGDQARSMLAMAMTHSVADKASGRPLEAKV